MIFFNDSVEMFGIDMRKIVRIAEISPVNIGTISILLRKSLIDPYSLKSDQRNICCSLGIPTWLVDGNPS